MIWLYLAVGLLVVGIGFIFRYTKEYRRYSSANKKEKIRQKTFIREQASKYSMGAGIGELDREVERQLAAKKALPDKRSFVISLVVGIILIIAAVVCFIISIIT